MKLLRLKMRRSFRASSQAVRSIGHPAYPFDGRGIRLLLILLNPRQVLQTGVVLTAVFNELVELDCGVESGWFGKLVSCLTFRMVVGRM
jgi:hypothetical protein